jgi:hypothetical protein
MSDTLYPQADYYDVEWQDVNPSPIPNSTVAGGSRFSKSNFDLALLSAYSEWRRTPFRHVRVVTSDFRIVVQYYPRQGTK